MVGPNDNVTGATMPDELKMTVDERRKVLRIMQEEYLQANRKRRSELLDQAEQGYDKALLLLNEHPDHQALSWQQAWLEIHLERWGLFYLLADTKKMQVLQEEIKPILDQAGSPDQKARYYANQVSTILRRERYLVSAKTVEIAESMGFINRPFHSGCVSFFHISC